MPISLSRRKALQLAAGLPLGVLALHSLHVPRASYAQSWSPRQLNATLSGAGLARSLVTAWGSAFRDNVPGVTLSYSSSTPNSSLLDSNDFVISDRPLSAGSGLLQFPVVVTGVVPVVKLPGVSSFNTNPEILSAVYFESTISWNDARIASLNSSQLSSSSITRFYQSSSTNAGAIMLNYLKRVDSTNWGNSADFAQGSSATADTALFNALSNSTRGFGFLSYEYVQANSQALNNAGILRASVRNSANQAVSASATSLNAAASGLTLANAPGGAVANAAGNSSYPLAGLLWVVVRSNHADASSQQAQDRLRALADFLYWSIRFGTAASRRLGFAELSAGLISEGAGQLAQLRANEAAVFSAP